jgi:hypothetical protein
MVRDMTPTVGFWHGRRSGRALISFHHRGTETEGAFSFLFFPESRLLQSRLSAFNDAKVILKRMGKLLVL